MIVCLPSPSGDGPWTATCTCGWTIEVEPRDLRLLVELHESLHMIEIRDAGDA